MPIHDYLQTSRKQRYAVIFLFLAGITPLQADFKYLLQIPLE